jgi:hypothetical protein
VNLFISIIFWWFVINAVLSAALAFASHDDHRPVMTHVVSVVLNLLMGVCALAAAGVVP